MRRIREELDDTGQDSFLDVVANIVGVLVILIMLVGASASQSVLQSQQAQAQLAQSQPTQTQAPQTQPALPQLTKSEQTQRLLENQQPATGVAQQPKIKPLPTEVHSDALNRELEELQRKANRTASIVRQTAARARNLRLASAQHEGNRIELLMHQAILKQDLELRRSKLDEKTKQEYDTQQQAFAVKLKLRELAKVQMSLASEPSNVEELEVLPTPVARRVDGDSIHLWVKGGRVSVVPFNEMRDQLLGDLGYFRRVLANKGGAKATLGPVEGFRLRVTMVERVESGAVTGPQVGRAGQRREIYPVLHWIPDSDKLGFNVEQVLLPNSSFLKRMQKLRNESDVIVVWLYKDSFDQFRPLKKMLYELGFLFDVRIMPLDAYIGASSHGRKSYAQ